MFVWHHHSLLITQYFSHYLCGHPVQLFLFFSLAPKLTEPSEKKKKKKKKKRTEQPTQEKKKNKNKNKESNSQPRRRKEKKKG